MSWVKGLLTGTKFIDKVTDIVEESVTDKDKRNSLVAKIMLIMMQSKVAPYIRGVIAILTIVSFFYFGDKITLDPETQKYLLGGIYSFYFFDRLVDFFGRRKK